MELAEKGYVRQRKYCFSENVHVCHPLVLTADGPTCYHMLVYDRRSYGVTILIMGPPPSQICYFKTLNINLYECYKLKKNKKKQENYNNNNNKTHEMKLC